ncbi:MAG: MFS transporter [Clostridiaceae bacterium]|nr:MFS transporter [Clostridiaceae bacterium]
MKKKIITLIFLLAIVFCVSTKIHYTFGFNAYPYLFVLFLALIPPLKSRIYKIYDTFILPILMISLGLSLFIPKISLLYDVDNSYYNRFVITLSNIGFLCLTLYILTFAFSFFYIRIKNTLKSLPKEDFILILAIGLILNIICAIYISKNLTVYYWDTAGYWKITRTIMDKSSSLVDFINNVLYSVKHEDYNYIPIVPVSLFYYLFGSNRTVFVLSLINFYTIPSLLLLYYFIKRFSFENPKTTFVLSLLFYPYIYYTAIIGFVDVGGIIISLLVLILYFNGKISYGKSFVISMLLALLYLFRRWFLFWSVSFFIASFIAIFFVKDKKLKLERFKHLIFSGFSFGFLLCFYFWPLVYEKLLKTNYSEIYKAYSFSLAFDISLFLSQIGIVTILSFILGALFALYKKKEEITYFLINQFLICFILFKLTQSHGQQHLLLYFPSLFYFTCSFISFITQKPKAKIFSTALGIIITFSVVFLPYGVSNPLDKFKAAKIIPGIRLQSEMRFDILDLISFKKKMKNLCGNDKKFVFLSSSFYYNYDTIANLESSIGFDELDNSFLLYNPQVDLRDGFPYVLFNADYFVVPTPIQTHLPQNTQLVITIPAQLLLNNEGFGKAFEKIEEIKMIAPNYEYITFNIYKKAREITLEEKRDLAQRFWEHYPENPLFPSPLQFE